MLIVFFHHTGKWMCPACLFGEKRRMSCVIHKPSTIARIIYALKNKQTNKNKKQKQKLFTD